MSKESEERAKKVTKITIEVQMSEQGVEKLKSQQQSYWHALDSKASDLAAPKNQLQQVQDGKAKLSQALAESEHSAG